MVGQLKVESNIGANISKESNINEKIIAEMEQLYRELQLIQRTKEIIRENKSFLKK